MNRIEDTSREVSIDLESPEFLTDPFPFYVKLRSEAPVLCTRMSYMGDQDIYLLSRYRDCVDLTTDHRFRRIVEGSVPFPIPQALKFIATDGMIMMDDPEHMRLRKLVSRAFTPKAIARLADRTEEITNELLDGLSRGQQIDVLEDYALPIPVTVISEMVGVPEADRGRFHDGMNLVMNGMAEYGLEQMAVKMEPVIDFVRDWHVPGERGHLVLESCNP